MKQICAFLLTLPLLLVLGCGDSKKSAEEKALQAMQQSFDSAPAELKAKYDDLKTAVESGDFAKAKADLDQLLQAQLSPEQAQAVAAQRQALILKASVAAQNGDANAVQLIQSLRSGSRGR
jgi:predicted negative regulator of RcsB-dependent stress response